MHSKANPPSIWQKTKPSHSSVKSLIGRRSGNVLTWKDLLAWDHRGSAKNAVTHFTRAAWALGLKGILETAQLLFIDLSSKRSGKRYHEKEMVHLMLCTSCLTSWKQGPALHTIYAYLDNETSRSLLSRNREELPSDATGRSLKGEISLVAPLWSTQCIYVYMRNLAYLRWCSHHLHIFYQRILRRYPAY
jgi:hypothetical protein